MRTLGIDPGSRVTGYGVVEQAGSRIVRVDHGEIRIKNSESFTRCLSRIYDELTEVIDRTKPDAVALEDIFYGKNVKSLIKQGHVRGVALLAASRSAMPERQQGSKMPDKEDKRNPLVDPENLVQERAEEGSLRPRTLAEYVGRSA